MIITTMVREIELGQKWSFLYCSRAVEGLKIDELSPRNTDLVEKCNKIPSLLCLPKLLCVVSFCDRISMTTF